MSDPFEQMAQSDEFKAELARFNATAGSQPAGDPFEQMAQSEDFKAELASFNAQPAGDPFDQMAQSEDFKAELASFNAGRAVNEGDSFREPEGLRSGVSGALAYTAEAVPYALRKGVGESARALYRGDIHDVADKNSGVLNAVINWSDKAEAPDKTLYDQEDKVIKATQGGVDSLGASLSALPYSIAGGAMGASMGASLGTLAGPGAPAAVPFGAAVGLIGGATGAQSIPMRYAEERRFLEEMRDRMVADAAAKGQTLSVKEIEAALSDPRILALAAKSGDAEAFYEGLDDPTKMLAVGMGGKSLQTALGKALPGPLRVIAPLAGGMATSILGETATDMEQRPAYEEGARILGLSTAPKPGEGYSDKPFWDRAKKSFEDVGPTTAALELITGGAFGAVGLSRQAYQSKKGTEDWNKFVSQFALGDPANPAAPPVAPKDPATTGFWNRVNGTLSSAPERQMTSDELEMESTSNPVMSAFVKTYNDLVSGGHIDLAGKLSITDLGRDGDLSMALKQDGLSPDEKNILLAMAAQNGLSNNVEGAAGRLTYVGEGATFAPIVSTTSSTNLLNSSAPTPAPQADAASLRAGDPSRLNATAFPGSSEGNRLSSEQIGAFMTDTPVGQALSATLAELRAAGHNDLADKIQITSANAGGHVPNSRHYKGQAVDINAKALTTEEQAILAGVAQRNGLVHDVAGEPWHFSYRGQNSGETAAPASSLADRIIQAESNGNPNAQAGTSSARGLGQFTKGTRNDIMQRHGVDAWSSDPAEQRRATEILIEENRQALRQGLGREPNDGEIYMAQFLGAGGASKFLPALSQAPNDVAANHASEAAVNANQSIFYHTDQKGRPILDQPRTVQQVYDLMAAKVGGGQTVSAAAQAVPTQTGQPGAAPQTIDLMADASGSYAPAASVADEVFAPKPAPQSAEVAQNLYDQPLAPTAQPAAPIVAPQPEPQAYIDAQVQAMANPQSSKRAVLVTPGSPLPTNLPPGTQAFLTQHGTVLTSDPQLVRTLPYAATDEQMGAAVLNWEGGRPPTVSGGKVVRALDANGTPVGEVHVLSKDVPKAMEAMRALSPVGKAVKVSLNTALADRQQMLAQEQQAPLAANEIGAPDAWAGHSFEDLQKALGKAVAGATIAETPDGHRIDMPNGTVLHVNRIGAITIDRAAARAQGHSDAAIDRAIAAGGAKGSFRMINGKGIIQLTEAGRGELGHELMHFARVAALTAKQNAILDRAYMKDAVEIAERENRPQDVKDILEEVIAKAYNEWLAKRGADRTGMFAIIRRFFRGIRQSIKPAEGVFEKVASGEAWTQETDAVGEQQAGDQYALAYHGSPHRGIEQFNWEGHRLTGEGAAAYGEGTYLAGATETAKTYMPRDMKLEEKLQGMYSQAERRGDYTLMEVLESAMLHETPAELQARYGSEDYGKDYKAAANKVAAFIKKNSKQGQLYEADIPEADELMDWDKPLSQQPAGVRENLEKAGLRAKEKKVYLSPEMDSKAELLDMIEDDADYVKPDGSLKDGLELRKGEDGKWAVFYEDTGDGIYMALARKLNSGEAASQYLRSIGIPGHRYLDGMSRDKGDGSHNYVIYDDSRAKITKTFYSLAEPVREYAEANTGWSEKSGKIWEMLGLLSDFDRRVSALVSEQRTSPQELAELFTNNPDQKKLWAQGVEEANAKLKISLPAFDVKGLVPQETLDILGKRKGELPDGIKNKVGQFIGGHGRSNAFEINKVLRDNQNLRAEVDAVQEQINELFGLTPIVDKEGIVTLGIERRMPKYESGKENPYRPQFGGFGRTFTQTFVDYLPDQVFETFRSELTRAVEHAYRNGGQGLEGVTFLDKTMDTVSDSDFRTAGPVKKAEKTVGALNLNSACPMFMIGSHGCYLDGCYVTGMGMGGQGIVFYSRAAYTGEILQLSQEDVDLLNSVGGLRVNGQGDLTSRQYGQLRDIVSHAKERSLKLKIITKQDATIDMLSKMHGEGVDISGVQVQTSIDPYWVPITEDELQDSFVQSAGMAGALKNARGSADVERLVLDLYKSQGREAKVIDGVIYRKYGFSIERFNELNRQHPNVMILPRAVVGTPEEIVHYARNYPGILQTWMHAAIRPGLFSDVAGKVLGKGDVGNFTKRIAVYQDEAGEWHIQAQAKSANEKGGDAVFRLTKDIRSARQDIQKAQADMAEQGEKAEKYRKTLEKKDSAQVRGWLAAAEKKIADAKEKLDIATAGMRDAYAERNRIVNRRATGIPLSESKNYKRVEDYIKTQSDADRIFRVLSGSLEEDASGLCCSAGADKDACNNCTSGCHQGADNWTGKTVKLADLRVRATDALTMQEKLAAKMAEIESSRMGQSAPRYSLELTEEEQAELYASVPKYSIRTKPDPVKTVKAYKLFKVKAKHKKGLFALYIDADTNLPTETWLDAEEGEILPNGKVKSKLGPLAYRPGLHAGDLPIATHIGDFTAEQKAERARIEAVRKDTAAREGITKKQANKRVPYPDWAQKPSLRAPDQLWAEIEMAADRDWQPLANERGTNKKGKIVAGQAHITDQIPVDGFYRYKTNANMTGNWLIGGAMKIKRILSDAEVKAINDAAGVKDLPRLEPFDAKKYGFDSEDGVQYSLADTAGANANEVEDAQRMWAEMGTESPYFKKWFGDSKVVDEDGKPMVVYHGTEVGYEGEDMRESRQRSLDFKMAWDLSKQFGVEKTGSLEKIRAVLQSRVDAAEKRFSSAKEKSESDSFDSYKEYIDKAKTEIAWGQQQLRDFDQVSSNGKTLEGGFTRDGLLEYIERNNGSLRHFTEMASRPLVDSSEVERFKSVFDKASEDMALFDIVSNEDRVLAEKRESNPFNVFMTNPDHSGRGRTDDGYLANGSYFSPDRNLANRYGRYVHDVYLAINNPLTSITPELQAEINKESDRVLKSSKGYLLGKYASNPIMAAHSIATRTVAIQHGYDGQIGNYGEGVEYVAFYPNQIKSATGNRGTFDSDSPNIQYSLNTANPLLTQDGLPSETLIEFVQRKMQDRMNRLTKTVKVLGERNGAPLADDKNAALLENLYQGRTEEALRQVEADHIKPLIDAIQAADVTVADVEDALYAMHAKRRNMVISGRTKGQNISGSGITDAEADQIMDDLRNSGKLAKLYPIIRRVWNINKARLALLKSSGLESADTLDLWYQTYGENYVPLKNGADIQSGLLAMLRGAETTRGMGTGRGYDIRGRESRHATGRHTKAGNILANILADYETTIIRAEKNRVGQAFLRMAEDNPDPKMWEIDKTPTKATFNVKTGEVETKKDPRYKLADNVFSVKVDGKEHLITIKDEVLARAMKNLGAESGNMVLRMFAGYNRAMSLINTSLDPEFTVSNFLRDIQTAGFNLTAEDKAALAAKILKDTATGKPIRGIYRALREKNSAANDEWSRWFDRYRKAGGKVGFFGLRSVEDQANRIEGMLSEANGGAWASTKAGTRAVLDYIGDVNGAVENGMRLAVFRRSVEAGLSEEQAAGIAKELTVNFNKRGEISTGLNALYLFANASVQGNARILKALTTSKRGLILSGAIVASSVALAALNRQAGGDDEDGQSFYDKIDASVKARNLVLMKWWKDDGSYMTLPLPYGYNTLKVIGDQIESMAAGKQTPLRASGKIVSAFVDAFNPLGSSGTVIGTFLPTISRPFVDLATNTDFGGNPIKPTQSKFGPNKPESQLAWSNTAKPAKWVAEELNKLTGGNEFEPGKIDVSPEVIEHLWSSYTGGVARFANRVVNLGMNAYQGTAPATKDIPFARRLMGEQSPYVTPKQYREMSDTVLRKQEAYMAYRETDPERAKAYRQDNLEELAMVPKLTEADKAMKPLVTKRNEIKAMDLSDAEKALRFKPIDAQMATIQKAFIKDYMGRDATPQEIQKADKSFTLKEAGNMRSQILEDYREAIQDGDTEKAAEIAATARKEYNDKVRAGHLPVQLIKGSTLRSIRHTIKHGPSKSARKVERFLNTYDEEDNDE